MDPLQQHQLIRLPGDRVGEGGPDAPFFGLEPQAGGEGVHLRDLFPHQAVHVVGAHGEGEDKAVGEGRLRQRLGHTETGETKRHSQTERQRASYGRRFHKDAGFSLPLR